MHIVDVCFLRYYNMQKKAADDVFRLFRESGNCSNVETIKKEDSYDFRS